MDSVVSIELRMALTFPRCSSCSVCCDLSSASLLLLLLLQASVSTEIVHDSSSSDNIVSIPSTDLFCTTHKRHSSTGYDEQNVKLKISNWITRISIAPYGCNFRGAWHEWTTCPGSLLGNAAAGSRTRDLLTARLQVQRPNHYTTEPHHLSIFLLIS